MSKGLTEQQEIFSQTVASHPEMSLTEAYLLAYPKSNGKPQTIWSNASRLRNNPKIVARISEIKAKNAETLAIGKDDLLRVIRNYLFMEIDFTNPRKDLISAQLKAVELAMKLCGYEQAQNVNMTVTNEPKVILEDYDDGRGGYE